MVRLKLRVVTWSAITALTLAFPFESRAQSSRAESQRSVAFDRLDRTSRSLIAAVGCAISSAQARARGAFGPVESLGSNGMCLRRNGRAFGVFFEPDSAFTKASKLRVVDLSTMTRDTAAVDTLAILAEERAADAGLTKGYPLFERANRQFAPFSMRTDGDSIEVWLIPLGLVMTQAPRTVGGERAFIFSPDGRTLVREIDAADRYRPVTIPPAGPVEITSQEDDLPLVSELLMVNMLNRQGRDASVVTKTYRAQLVGRDPTAIWTQTRIR